MGAPNEAALASLEPEGIYEHMAIGVLEEGFTLAYLIGGNDNVKYDVYAQAAGIICVGQEICRNDRNELVKMVESRTDDDILTIRQTFVVSKDETRISLRMDIENCRKPRSVDIDDLLIKRYADIDVDTGGTAGWAGFVARWDRNRDSIFTYNEDGDAPEGKRSHVVNMVAMPGDLPLDETFVGKLGSQQYRFRNNPDPITTLPSGRIDAVGVLQWRASRLRAGESVRVNMYYDTFRGFAKARREE
jgi:hypothetical protein